jgi:hypothetical protein
MGGPSGRSPAVVQKEYVQLAALSAEKFKDLYYTVCDTQRDVRLSLLTRLRSFLSPLTEFAAFSLRSMCTCSIARPARGFGTAQNSNSAMSTCSCIMQRPSSVRDTDLRPVRTVQFA